MPLAPSLGSVLATTITRSASWPLLMKVFEPLMTQWLPSMTAVVLTDCRSEPVPGSVMAMAVTRSPEQALGIHFFFCSSVP